MSPRFALHVQSVGDGPTVIAVHGFGDDGEVWGHQRPALRAAGYRVITVDLPGHGRSTLLAGDDDDAAGTGSEDDRGTEAGTGLTRQDGVDVLTGLAEQPDLGRPVTMMGHSLGGYLSLVVAIRRPELVDRLVLVAAGPGFRDPQARERWNASIDRSAARLGRPAIAGLAHMPDDLVMASLGDVQMPALLIVGEHDERFMAGVQVLAAKLPRAELAVIDDAGHDCFATHSTVVNQRILAFFDTTTR